MSNTFKVVFKINKIIIILVMDYLVQGLLCNQVFEALKNSSAIESIDLASLSNQAYIHFNQSL